MAVRRAEEEAKKLNKEMIEAKRVNVVIDRKHQLFLKTLERLNQTAQQVSGELRLSDVDVEQKALVFWFNSSRGLRRASWLLRTAVVRSKAIRSLKERVAVSEGRRVACKVFNSWYLLLRVRHFRDTISLKRTKRQLSVCIAGWRQWAVNMCLNRKHSATIIAGRNRRVLHESLECWLVAKEVSVERRRELCDKKTIEESFIRYVTL